MPVLSHFQITFSLNLKFGIVVRSFSGEIKLSESDFNHWSINQAINQLFTEGKTRDSYTTNKLVAL